MGIGLGVVLVLAGAIIYWALNFDISVFNESMLGIILMVVGGLSIVLGLIQNAQRNRTRR